MRRISFHELAERELRNTFHHVNADIPTDSSLLAARAEECANALCVIESEVFAFEIVNEQSCRQSSLLAKVRSTALPSISEVGGSLNWLTIRRSGPNLTLNS